MFLFHRWSYVFGTLILLGAFVVLSVPYDAVAQSLEELRQELDSKRDVLKNAEERIKKFRNEIQLKRKEAHTLEDQIDIIDDNISQLQLGLAQTTAEIDEADAEIATVVEEIKVQELELEEQKRLLAEYLRSLYSLNQQSNVTVFLKYSTFSEAVSETSTLEELQQRGQEALIAIKELKEELENKKNDLEGFKETLEKLRERQKQQQSTLVVTRESKNTILRLTKEQEAQFNSLLKESQAAHQAADAEIKHLDAAIREELKKQGKDNLPSVGVMNWPVEPIFGISCPFHCAGYPYAYLIGPHSGIDIPTYVGTPITAPADGYVARAHNASGPGYSYILLLHGDGVSTVYGHVSGFGVTEGQTVSRGSVIGYTGGAPGTNGAGLSSGPHLHFEVRVNNAAVNPQNYL